MKLKERLMKIREKDSMKSIVEINDTSINALILLSFYTLNPSRVLLIDE